MKYSVGSALLMASAAIAAPAPVAKRAADIDATILNYALTLEHLEAAFYTEGLKNFTAADFKKAGFTGKNFYKNLKKVERDETTHVAVITDLMTKAGYTPTKACTYAFNVLSPKGFVATASLLEGVGITAYLGAAAQITNKSYLTAAGSILTVEARHSAYLRSQRTQSPAPQAFDTPLDFNQVYSLAAPFIVECPSDNPDLGVSAFPALSLTPADRKNMYQIDGEVSFSVPEDFTFPDSPVYIAWPTVTGPIIVNATVDADAMTVTASIPSSGGQVGPIGQSYAILTSSATELTDDVTLAGPAFVSIQNPYLRKNN